jgi:hypothetical protein
MENFDVVIANNNEKEFIDTAIALGYDEILFLTKDINYKKIEDSRIKIRTGYLLHDPSEINRARKYFDYLFAAAQRKFFECKADYILDSENSERKDSFHYRNTSLNQVHAKLAKENGLSIVFGFSALLNSMRRERQMILGRMYQNAQISRKYKLNNSFFSMSKSPIEMRSKTLLSAFSDVLRL